MSRAPACGFLQRRSAASICVVDVAMMQKLRIEKREGGHALEKAVQGKQWDQSR